MRTLVITDLHLNNKIPGLIDAQIKCLYNLIDKEGEYCDRLVIMGDVFMHRSPSATELLALDALLQRAKTWVDMIILIRGNHDSETKADDGITALSVFDRNKCYVVTHKFTDYDYKHVYIAHFENEDTIIEHLRKVPDGFTVFGHFGFHGSLNSSGDRDFGIDLNEFNNDTYLGHIHRFSSRKVGQNSVVCLGTPYTTNFGEAFKTNYYCIIEEDSTPTYKTVDGGPRHVVYTASNLEANLETINDPAFFTFLRVVQEDEHVDIPYDKINVAKVEVVYAPVFDEEHISEYQPEDQVFTITEDIVDQYVEEANTVISKEDLMQGYRQLREA